MNYKVYLDYFKKSGKWYKSVDEEILRLTYEAEEHW